MSETNFHPAHFFSRGLSAQLNRTFFAFGDLHFVWLDEVDVDFAIHTQGGFIVRGGKPWGISFGTNRLQHVPEVFTDGDLFIGLRFRCNFKYVRKHITLRIVVDHFDSTFFVVVQRTEYGAIFAHTYLLTLSNGCMFRKADDLTPILRL